MGIDVLSTVGDSFSTLFRNRTVTLFALLGALVASIFSSMILSQAQYVHSISSIGTLPTAILPFITSVIGPILGGIIVVYLVDVFVIGSVLSATIDTRKDVAAAARHSISRYITLIITLIAVGVAVGIGFLLFVIPGIYLFVRLYLAPVEVMSGKKGVVDSIKSSWAITEGNFWGILFSVIVMFIAVYIISLVFGVIFGLLGLVAIGTFISTFFAYAFYVLLVRIRQQISGPVAPAVASRKSGSKK
ncbi:MAG: hypothetical protein M1286_04580 [Candidatus Marsarchaeota archaeon]|nr:hypothetical protein [Candidatus Marsarchaeota archaeon]